MNILLGCGDFTTISGVPMFFHTLAVELVERGHRVHLVAPAVGGEIAVRTRERGVTVTDFNQLGRKGWDVAHVSGLHCSQWAAYSAGCPVVATVHSTLIYETPYKHDRISHYACVRPQIMDKIIAEDGISPGLTSVIFNGVDRTRFHPMEGDLVPPTVLFAGTVDYLRAQAAEMILDLAKERGWRVIFQGRKLSGHLDDLPDHAQYREGDEWNIEEVLQLCTATAGVLLGRTTIEGWAAGIPGIIYEIDNDGNVLEWGEFDPPPPQIMELFDIKYMTTCYERLYERVQ